MRAQVVVSEVRLRKHADYQRVYAASRKYFSAHMGYFFVRSACSEDVQSSSPIVGPRVGITVPKALGKAVDRNRIKRRLRELIRRNCGLMAIPIDVVLHPKRVVLQMNFDLLEREVISVFESIARRVDQGPRSGDHRLLQQRSRRKVSRGSA